MDDGSTDGTSEMIREKFPEVTLLHGDGNLWWTAATNMGIRNALETACDDDYILVINDDLEVNNDYLEKLVRFAQSHPKALVGSVTIDVNDSDRLIVYGGVQINWWTAKRTKVNKGKRLSEFPPSHYVGTSSLTGRGALIPVPIFHQFGLYDDKHFKQCGDSELPVRAARNGYRLLVYYGAVVESHIDETCSLNTAEYYQLREMKDYFFGIRSNYRLRYHYYIIRTAANGNPFRFSIYLAADLARITLRFFLRIRF